MTEQDQKINVLRSNENPSKQSLTRCQTSNDELIREPSVKMKILKSP